MMPKHMRASLSAAGAVCIVFTLTLFTQWGFDPSGWTEVGRGVWSALTITFAGFAYVIAYTWDGL